MSTLTLGRWYLKCQRKSTIGTWVVKIGQKQVNIVIECPLNLVLLLGENVGDKDAIFIIFQNCSKTQVAITHTIPLRIVTRLSMMKYET